MKSMKPFFAKTNLVFGILAAVVSIVSAVSRIKSIGEQDEQAKRKACMKNHPSGKSKVD